MLQNVIENFTQTDTFLILSNFGSIIAENRWIIFIIYSFYILISIIWIRYTTKILLPLEKKANELLDHMWYEISLILYENGDNIHNKDETIPLLLHYKTTILQEKSDPRNNIDKLYQEYNYICELTNNKKTLQQERFEHYKKILSKLKKTQNSLKKTLGFSTLGLSNLFL